MSPWRFYLLSRKVKRCRCEAFLWKMLMDSMRRMKGEIVSDSIEVLSRDKEDQEIFT